MTPKSTHPTKTNEAFLKGLEALKQVGIPESFPALAAKEAILAEFKEILDNERDIISEDVWTYSEKSQWLATALDRVQRAEREHLRKTLSSITAETIYTETHEPKWREYMYQKLVKDVKQAILKII